MSSKGIATTITVCVSLFVALVISCMFIHKNNISQLQVIQSFTGSTSVRTQGGIYFKMFPTIWTYNKTNQVAFSFEKDESRDNDGVHVFFSNKGQGDVSTQVTYNILSEEEKVYKMLKNNRIRYFAPADYRDGSELDTLLKAIIDKTAAYEVLETKHVRDTYETR